MLLIAATLLGMGCTKELSECEILQEAYCECEGEAGTQACESAGEQIAIAERHKEDGWTNLYRDAQEVCGEQYEIFMEMGGCGSLTVESESDADADADVDADGDGDADGDADADADGDADADADADADDGTHNPYTTWVGYEQLDYAPGHTEPLYSTSESGESIRADRGCQIYWDLVGIPVNPMSIDCDGCEFMFDVTYTTDMEASFEYGGATDCTDVGLFDTRTVRMGYSPDFEGMGPTWVYLSPDYGYVTWGTAAFDGTTVSMTYGTIDYYHPEYQVYWTNYFVGTSTID